MQRVCGAEAINIADYQKKANHCVACPGKRPGKKEYVKKTTRPLDKESIL